MHLCLFEERAAQFEPICQTRPVFDLRCGITSLADKQMRQFGPTACGAWVRPALAELYSAQHPELHVNDVAWLQSGAAVLVNGRWLPPATLPESTTAPCVALVDGEVAYAIVAREHLQELSSDNLPELLKHWQQTLPNHAAGGRIVHYLWDLVEQNGQQVIWDFAGLGIGTRLGKSSAHLAVVGPANFLWIDPTARVEPMVVVDTTQGPVVIDHHAVISAFSRIEGPCYIGARSQVLGAKIRAGTTLGPQCRIGGEVEASIVHGYSNKYHDGFLGHSYVGEWVNLGAGTQNSDLRNDYGEVSVPLAGRPVPTGQKKVGCFLGDHTKTGLGVLLNTGTNVGAFCNLLPAGRYAPKYVPAFASWFNAALGELFTPEQMWSTAEQVMKRRGVELTDAHRTLYRHVFDETAGERRRLLRDGEPATRRRSA
jgi:UDP-N-acetylglucosamine diphosphorylase/glucosamine-1-phosphate N-acetyltransferase